MVVEAAFLVEGSLFFLDERKAQSYNTAYQNEEAVQIPIFNPRLPDLLLGFSIGLTIALAWHWVVWTVH